MSLRKILVITFALLLVFANSVYASSDTDLVLTLDELAEYDGKDGRPAYVAVDGVIYDFTESKAWENGGHNGFEAGKDLSNDIKEVSPHGLGVLERMPVVGRLADGQGASSSGQRNNLYGLLGWASLVMLVVMVLPYVLTRLNKNIFKTKSKGFFSFVKALRKIHKPLGAILGLVALVHGFLALGSFRLHTGSLLYLGLLLTVFLGAGFHFKKKPEMLKGHKAMATITILLLLIHFFLPWLI